MDNEALCHGALCSLLLLDRSACDHESLLLPAFHNAHIVLVCPPLEACREFILYTSLPLHRARTSSQYSSLLTMGWLLPLTYTRPRHVDTDDARHSEDSAMTTSDKSDGSVKSGNSGASSGIPDSLTFDKIINGGTCPVRYSAV